MTDLVQGGSIFTIALMVGAGYMGGNSLRIIRKDISRIEHVAIFSVVAFLALYFLYRHFKSGRKASQ